MNEKLKLAAIILGLGVVWGGYEFYDFNSGDQVKLQREEETKAQAVNGSKIELSKLKNFAEGIKEIKTSLKKTNAEFEDALEFIPRNLDLSKLLAKLNVLARNSGIELDSFKPLKEEAAKAGTKSFYQTVNLEIQLRGGFSQTVMFLDQISRLKRIINVETLKMTVGSVDTARLPSSLPIPVNTVINLKTYRFAE